MYRNPNPTDGFMSPSCVQIQSDFNLVWPCEPTWHHSKICITIGLNHWSLLITYSNYFLKRKAFCVLALISLKFVFIKVYVSIQIAFKFVFFKPSSFVQVMACRWTGDKFMMTSSNGNSFRVAGHLCGEFIGLRWIPAQRPVTRSFDVFFDLRLKERFSKQSWGWWFETSSRPLWRHRNVTGNSNHPVHWYLRHLWKPS